MTVISSIWNVTPLVSHRELEDGLISWEHYVNAFFCLCSFFWQPLGVLQSSSRPAGGHHDCQCGLRSHAMEQRTLFAIGVSLTALNADRVADRSRFVVVFSSD